MEKDKEITINQLQDWMVETKVVFAMRADGENPTKMLRCGLNGTFEVLQGTNVVYTGVQPFSALEAFNGLP